MSPPHVLVPAKRYALPVDIASFTVDLHGRNRRCLYSLHSADLAANASSRRGQFQRECVSHSAHRCLDCLLDHPDSARMYAAHSATIFLTFSRRTLDSRPNFLCPFLPPALALPMSLRCRSLSASLRFFSLSLLSNSACLASASAFFFSATAISFSKYLGFFGPLRRTPCGNDSAACDSDGRSFSGASSIACRSGWIAWEGSGE